MIRYEGQKGIGMADRIRQATEIADKLING